MNVQVSIFIYNTFILLTFILISSSSIDTPKLIFHIYILFSTYSLHGLIGEGRLSYNLYVNEKLNGNIQSRKMLAQRELKISNYMIDIYLLSLKKCIYYVHYVQILSKHHCGIFLQNTCYFKPGNI